MLRWISSGSPRVGVILRGCCCWGQFGGEGRRPSEVESRACLERSQKRNDSRSSKTDTSASSPKRAHTRKPMCGIVAYLGAAEAKDILVAGLQRLEYRGYDSAGVAIIR